MGRAILKIPTPIGDRYLEWGSITDSPITYGMTREEFYEYYREEYGNAGMQELESRMQRVDAKGTSNYDDPDLESAIAGNRAGAGETEMTLEQIVGYYCVKRGFGEKPVGTVKRDDD